MRGRAQSRGLGGRTSGVLGQDGGPEGRWGNHPSLGTGLECGPSAHAPPLPAAPGSGPPSSPPEASSLRAAPGAERAPPPAPTATGSPGAWPARAAAPRRAAPGSHLRDSRGPAALPGEGGWPGLAPPLPGPRLPRLRPSPASRAPPLPGLRATPPEPRPSPGPAPGPSRSPASPKSLSSAASLGGITGPGAACLALSLLPRFGRLSRAAAPGHRSP